MVRWTASTATDLSHYDVQSATDIDFTLTVVTRISKTTEWPLTGLVNGTRYYVRIRAVDLSGNAGLYSSITSRIVPRTGTDDNEDGSITAVKIANATITDAQIGSLNAGKITAGLLTVNPASGGATAIYVTNAGAIRLRMASTTPSRIVFEDNSAVEKAQITGSTIGIQITPITNSGMNLNLGSSSLGKQWGIIGLEATTDIYATAANHLQLTGSGGIQLSGPLQMDQVVSAAPGGALNKYIQLQNWSGVNIGRIAVYS